MVLWWCHTLLSRNWCACIQPFEWKSFAQSMCLCIHAQTSWSQNCDSKYSLWYVCVFCRDGARSNTSVFSDLCLLDCKGSRFSQLNTKNSDMMSKASNPLTVIKLPNLMSNYRTPFFRVNKLTGDLYAMESDTMVLITEKVTIMMQVSDICTKHHSDPSGTFSPSLGTTAGLTPPCSWV